MRSDLLRTIKFVAIAVAVFINWSYISYGQSNGENQEQGVPLYNLSETAENILFSFIRDNQAFATLLAIDADKIENLDLNREIVEGVKATVVSQLPFRKMYNQVIYKLKELSNFEESLAKLQKDEAIQNITQYSIMKNLKSAQWQLDVVLKELYNHHQFIKDYPNTFDMLILWTVFAHNTKEISLLKEELIEQGELLESMFAEAIAKYQRYIEENQDTFEKIEQVANNGFKINVVTKKCTQTEGKDFCVLEREFRAIRSLSEIGIYLEEFKDEETSLEREL